MTQAQREVLDNLGFQVEDDEDDVDLAHAWHHAGDDYDAAVAHGAAVWILHGPDGFENSLTRGGHLARVAADCTRWNEWPGSVRFRRDVLAAVRDAQS